MPLLDRLAEDRDVAAVSAADRAGAGAALRREVFVLLVRPRNGRRALARSRTAKRPKSGRALDGTLSEPPAVSPDGTPRGRRRSARTGKRRLAIMSADGTNPRTLGRSIDIQGAAGQGTVDWSPDGTWIVTGGSDAQGRGCSRSPWMAARPFASSPGQAVNPVWSPDGTLIVYAGPFVAGQVDLLGVTTGRRRRVELPPVQVRTGDGYRFLPDGTGLVYLRARFRRRTSGCSISRRGHTHQLTRFSHPGHCCRTFDITPDGKQIVFDRLVENSDIYLIDLPASRQ